MQKISVSRSFGNTGIDRIETIGILGGSDSTIVNAFLFADESRNSAMIFSASASSCKLRDASDIRDETCPPLLWCP